MSNVTINIRKEVEVWQLRAQMNVRYWEDATVNGKECAGYEDMPFADGDMWDIRIYVDDGMIQGWPKGTTADVHFKVCDSGLYELIDRKGETIVELSDYVPEMMCPEGGGFGDYVIMKIDENGKIANWTVELDEFQEAANEAY